MASDNVHAIIKKLNFKDQQRVAVLNHPEAFAPVVDAWREETAIDTDLRTGLEYEFILAFALMADDIHHYARQIKGRLVADPVLWIAYPKQSSKQYDSDISRDQGWTAIGELGFEGVRQVALDEDWSALRFRPAKHIRTMNRDPKRALSREGKRKADKK